MTINLIIVDDHQLFIDGIKSILSTEIGISVIGECHNGLEVIQLLEKGLLPDIIMTDIRMPIMNGIACTRAIAHSHPDIPVLALSMFDQEEDIIEMLEAGARGYIVKNTGKEEMLEAIYALHRKEEYYSPELSDKVKKYRQTKEISVQHPLSRREREILSLIAKGSTSVQIAKSLNISKLTVDTHRKNIHKKLGIKSNTGLVKYAITNNL